MDNSLFLGPIGISILMFLVGMLVGSTLRKHYNFPALGAVSSGLISTTAKFTSGYNCTYNGCISKKTVDANSIYSQDFTDVGKTIPSGGFKRSIMILPDGDTVLILYISYGFTQQSGVLTIGGKSAPFTVKGYKTNNIIYATITASGSVVKSIAISYP